MPLRKTKSESVSDRREIQKVNRVAVLIVLLGVGVLGIYLFYEGTSNLSYAQGQQAECQSLSNWASQQFQNAGVPIPLFPNCGLTSTYSPLPGLALTVVSLFGLAYLAGAPPVRPP